MILFLTMIVVAIASAIPTTRPEGLLCNLSPRAVGVTAPSFSWIVPHLHLCTEAGPAQQQHAFSIELFLPAAPTSLPLWQSGHRVSNQSSLVVLLADPAFSAALLPGTQYHWRVRVALTSSVANPDCLSDWSERSTFVTALWDGWAPGVVPIWPPSGNYAYARAVIMVPDTVVAAVAFASAYQDSPNQRLLGAYRLYVQNQAVTTGPGRGAVASAGPNHTLYDTIDVLPFLADVAPGAAVAFGLQGYHPDVPSAGMVLEVHLTLLSGGQLVLGTNASWRAFDATAVYNPTASTQGAYAQPLEYINASNWQLDWPSVAFAETAAWAPAISRPAASAMTAKQTQPLQITTVSPAVLTQTAPGKWFFDFGTEHMAGLRLTVPSGAGVSQVSFALGEELTAPATVLSPLRTGNVFTGVWTMASAGVSVFEHHEYMAWRYGELVFADPSTCATAAEGGVVTLQCAVGATIAAVVFASYGTPAAACPFPRANASCSAATSQSVVEQLCVGRSSCSISATNAVFGGDPCHLTPKQLVVAVQCSATADAAVAPFNFTLEAWRVQYPFVETDAAFDSAHAGLNQVWQLCRNTIRRTSLDTFTDSNTRERTPYEADGYITAESFLTLQRDFTWPRHATEFVLFNPTWPTEWRQTTPLLALMDYMATGDAGTFAANYALLVQNSQLHCLNATLGLIDFRSCARQTGTRDVIDWPESARDGYVLSDVSTVISAYGVVAAKALAVLACEWGFEADATEFGRNATALTQGLLGLYDGRMGVFVDGLNITHAAFQATVFPTWAGVVPDDAARAVLSYLGSRGMVGSVYAAYAFLGGLYRLDNDHGALAFDTLTACINNSWCNMLNQGSMDASGKAQPELVSSVGNRADIDYRVRAHGINGADTWFPVVKPQPGPLSWASMTRPTLSGFFSISFNQTAGNFTLRLTAPGNTNGTVCLPALAGVSCSLVVNGAPAAGICLGDYVCVSNIGTGELVFSRF